MNIFVVNGYGTPKDIFSDENYRTYLNIVFNKIFATSANQEALIIPSGGPTRTESPFEGTEAGAMASYLKKLAGRAEMGSTTERWEIVPEDESLSTLENLLFAKKIMDGRGAVGSTTIFCEVTRKERIDILAKNIFGSSAVVEPVDFDLSKVRYIDPVITKKKEAAALEECLWTLEDPKRLPLHHEFYQRKLDFLRERQEHGLSHIDAVEEWYRKGPEELRALMPDHPLLHKIER